MAINPTNRNTSLGTTGIKAFGTLRQNEIIDNIILQLNEILDGVYTMTDLTLTGTLTIAGATTSSNTTQSTNKDTGAIVTEGGIGVEKNVNIGGALGVTGQSVLAAGTVSAPGLVVGANDNGIYEISATQLGVTIGNALKGGFDSNGIFTGTITEQVVGVGIDISGIRTPWVAIKGPSAVISVATGAAITAAQLVTGYIRVTGATGNVALPSAADITTALGTSPVGTSFNFVINAKDMTAANVVTLTVGANMSVPTTPIITGSGTLTVAQDVQVVGRFTCIYDTATSIKIFRTS